MKNSRLVLRFAALAILAFLLLPLLVAAASVAPPLASPQGVGYLLCIGATLSFLDLAKANSNDIVGGLIEEVQAEVPELAVFDSEDLMEPGQLSYETLHRTALPTVSFAAAGQGFTATKSEIKLVTHECFRFGGRVECPRHIADNWRRGGAAGYQAFEAMGVMKAAMKLIGKQIFYGVSNDGLGFPGLKAFTPFGGAYTYNAAGTTAGAASSVYYVKFGEQYVRLMAGRARNAAGIFDLPDFRIGDMTDADSKKMEAYISELSSFLGLQIAAEASVVRICNLTAEASKTVSDAMLNNGKNLFPAGWVPDVCFMSRRSRTQLQTSRTVTLYGTGNQRPTVGNIAPIPTTDADGVPIVATDSILNTDTIEA